MALLGSRLLSIDLSVSCAKYVTSKTFPLVPIMTISSQLLSSYVRNWYFGAASPKNTIFGLSLAPQLGH
jgi:hypothetical protein